MSIFEAGGQPAPKGESARSRARSAAYHGVYYVSGKLWSSSWQNSQPLIYELGSGDMLQGWEKGLRGMRAGGRRKLIIPPELVYGRGTSAGPESTLIYVIDLMAID